jgi:hypothetical protein
MPRWMTNASMRQGRPYAIAVLAAALIVFFPGLHDDGDQTATDVSTSNGERASEATVAGAASADEQQAQETTAGGAVGGALSTATTLRAAGPVAVPTGAGLNSPEALAAPDCDTTRRRMKVSFTRAAPCAVPWPAGSDNGGATTRGVTAETIKVVIYNPPTDPQNPPIGGGAEADLLKGWQRASEPYQRFYRTWGRKVQYAVFSGTGNDEVAQRADAIKIAAMNPFAVMQIPANSTVLMTELAARKVVAVAAAGISENLAAKLAPYVWGSSVQPPEQVLINAAHYVSQRIMGHPARWAGSADLQAKTRAFGLIQADDVDQGLFEREFSKLGGTLADKETYSFGASNANKWAEQARTTVARMKGKGVTSIIAAADFLYLAIITKEATNQQWFPEWVTTGLLGQDIDLFAKTFDQVQWRHAFGAGSLYAGTDVPAPQFHFQKWYWGEDWDGTQETGLGADEAAVLYSGIHGAGPRLTPETFRDGLFAVEPTGGAAVGGLMTMVWSYGRHGYYPGDDHNGYDDFTEIWWDATSQGRDNLLGEQGVGLYRYVNRGKRYFFNQWTKGEPNMFDMNGTAPFYTDYPTPQERPPDIPCPKCPSTGG